MQNMKLFYKIENTLDCHAGDFDQIMETWRRYFSMLDITHPPLDKMAAISQKRIQITFSWMKNFEFQFKFHWSLFLMAQLTIMTEHWFR